MAKRLTIHNKNNYDIIIDKNFNNLSSEIQNLDIPIGKICVVTDTTVDKYHSAAVLSELSKISSNVIKFVFPAGESSKTLQTVQNLYEYLILNNFERRDMLVALGGGVVGDLTGFAAATYLRGIPFIQIPTTLLAQVDSSIGGKTGVDFSAYKNMVGAFYMPRLVYMNLSVLNTLDNRVYIEGFGEIIKHAYIKDTEYLSYLQNNIDEIKKRSYDCLEHVVYRSCQIKGSVVEEDPTEKGIRAILNFGHTLGHSIEKLSEFTLYHGECVVLGMICALKICLTRNLISTEDYIDACKLFKDYGFPTTISNITIDDVIKVSKSDKKMDNGLIKFILLTKVGNAYIDKTVTDDEMKQALKEVIL